MRYGDVNLFATPSPRQSQGESGGALCNVFLLKAIQKVTWPACQKIRSLIILWPACKSLACTPANTFNNSFYAAKSLACMPENSFNNSYYTAKSMACMPDNTFNNFYTNSPLATIILIMYIKSLAN